MFIHSISRSSGGLSSSWDLADAFYRNGFDICVVVNRKRLFHKKDLSKVSNYPHRLYWNRDFLADASKRRTVKARLRNLFITLWGNDVRLRWALKKASYVIDASMLDHKSIHKIRTLTKGKIVRNHAGSPQKFEKFWLNNRPDLLKKESNSKYLEYCAWFDGLLFQSSEQEKDYINRAKERSTACKTYLLKPSCQEEELAKVKCSELKMFDSTFFNVVIIASIQYIKGIDLALQVLKEVIKIQPQVHFHFVGKYFDNESVLGEYYRKQKEYISDQKLEEYCTFHGFKNDFLYYINAADLVLQPSREEGVSRVLRESMFLEKPILAYAISGTRDLLKNNESAILVSPESIEGMVRALINIVEMKSEHRNDMAQRAFETYMENNSRDVYDRQLKKIFS